MSETVRGVRVVRWTEIEPALRPAVETEIDRVFFVSSSVQSFPSDDERCRFRERWLGRYLTHDPEWAFVALRGEDNREGPPPLLLPPRGGGQDGGMSGPQVSGHPLPTTPPHREERDCRAVGYVAGAIADPARTERFADIPYFKPWAQLTAAYPAHLHINVAPEWRSAGVGATLIEVFAAAARAAGAPGLHVVTGQGMRNVRFYLRNGFRELAALDQLGKTVVFLGRRL